MKKNIYWLLPVLTCIVASVASLFLPVLTWVNPHGIEVPFNIVDFVEQSPTLFSILSTYSGPLSMNIDQIWLTILAILAVLAIIAALVGVITMSMQRPNTWQFTMTLVEMIGTAIPAILVLVAVPLSRTYFLGTFQCGVYPIITPIAMILCVITVTKKHKLTQAELRAVEKAKGLIRPGGNL